MYNKKVLKKATEEANKKKSVSKPNDIITDPEGQWKYPGQVTRVPSSNITMQGVPYPVWAQPETGIPQIMYPGQEYNFPGADYVDEYPLMKKGGFIELELDDNQIEQYRKGGCVIKEMQDGGEIESIESTYPTDSELKAWMKSDFATGTGNEIKMGDYKVLTEKKDLENYWSEFLGTKQKVLDGRRVWVNQKDPSQVIMGDSIDPEFAKRFYTNLQEPSVSKSPPTNLEENTSYNGLKPPQADKEWVRNPKTGTWYQIERPIVPEYLETRTIGFM